MAKQKKTRLMILVVLAIVFVALFFPRMGTVSDWKHPPLVFYLHAALIRDRLCQFASDHDGNLPSRLSELVPAYVAYTNIQLFSWPPKPWAISNASPDYISRKIDEDGAFVYLGKPGVQKNMILYQRPNLWPQNWDKPGVVILPADFGTRLESARNASNRIFNLPQRVSH